MVKSAQAGTDPKALADAQTAHDAAQKSLSDAKGRLATLASVARQADDDLAAAAKECAKALHHASHDGIHNKHWWQHVGETLNRILFREELPDDWDVEAPWTALGERELTDEDGRRISEWDTDMAAIRDFLQRTTGV